MRESVSASGHRGQYGLAGPAGASFASMRLVHSHLNLVGFVGLTIIGTLPTFLPTVAHHRAVSGREAAVAWGMGVAGAVAMAAGLWAGSVSVGIGTLLVGSAATVILAGIVIRLGEKARGRTELLQVGLGTAWLILWTIVDGARLLAGMSPVPFGGWTGAAVVSGVGQVLAGALAYLLPVLAGPPLGDNAARMTARPVVPLLAANLAGLALVGGLGPAAVLAVAVWAGDFGLRVAGLRRPLVPDDSGPSAPSG